jgi:hypothetical protein
MIHKSKICYICTKYEQINILCKTNAPRSTIPSITWQQEDLMFAILGGIRIEGLHSMRITLKAEFKTCPRCGIR